MASINILSCSQRIFRSILKSQPVCSKHQKLAFCQNNTISQLRSISNTVNKNNLDEKFNKKVNKPIKNFNFERSETKDLELNSNHDPDSFGNLDENFKLQQKLDEMPEEEDDVHETVIYHESGGKRQLTINQYAKIIKHFLNKKKLGNALDVLETRMLKEDKMQPDVYIYNLLISGCARYGYTKKAFQLFNQMKKRGLQPTASTYTSLLNACSKSPWQHDGIKRVSILRDLMLEKGYSPNQANYHAMIKAYGRCNDLESAFTIVDEMLQNNIPVNVETFNFLLQSCISDTEAGFRHALLVWSKMLSKGLKPDLYSFNLILRCSRDCGIGSVEATKDVINKLIGATDEKNIKYLDDPRSQKNDVPTITDIGSFSESKDNESNQLTSSDNSIVIENRPNLLSRHPHLGNIIGLMDIKQAEHRLLLLGGCEGFLKEMTLNKIKPDIKTFSQLLEAIPSTLSAEQSLLNNLSKFKIEPDIDFFNLLIKKRSMRNDYKNARQVLRSIQEHRLSPDIVTFGVLALSCCTLEEGLQLKSDMNDIGFRMNIQILGALLRNATTSWDCDYVMEIMRTILDESVTPSPQFMNYLNQFYFSVGKFIQLKEDGNLHDLSEEEKKFIDKINDEQFMHLFRNYCHFYKLWSRKAVPEAPLHPYAQFQKHNDPEDIAVMNTGRKR